MKKFCLLSMLFLLIALFEVGKYFFDFTLFYPALVFQIIGFGLFTFTIFKSTKSIRLFSIFCFLINFILLMQNFVILTENKNTTNEFSYVVHGGGAMDGQAYLNCQEGFNYYVQNGYNYIELDFLYTSDNEIICSHFLENVDGYDFYNRPSLEQFSTGLIQNKYHGITMEFLMQELKNNPQIYIIFDTKEANTEALLEDLTILLTQNEIDFNRFIIQVYSPENYNSIKQNDDIKFERFWYTNYKLHLKSFEVLKYFEDCADVECYVLYINDWWVFTEFDFNTSKSIAVHTIHNRGFCDFITSKNVDYVFIDWPI